MTTRPFRFALLADGSSDRALVHVIRWVIAQHRPDIQIAQPGFRRRNPGEPLRSEMQESIASFAPDVLFVHRDAERDRPDVRRREIPDLDGGVVVRVVPVRMTEAWFLFDEQAIRTAANHPRGTSLLELPVLRRMEEQPDPKQLLHQALFTAAEVAGRRRKRFQRDLPTTVQRVAELIADFGPLRILPAFQQFEHDCRPVLLSWASGGTHE